MKPKKKLQEFWTTYIYLIIDEYSMMSKSFLHQLEKNITIGKGSGNNGSTFGGISVILCGDLHQFPPVCGELCDALYCPPGPGDNEDQKMGRLLYKEFTTVVILTEQMQVVDDKWQKLLSKLHHSEAWQKEVETLQKLVLDHPDCPQVDASSAEWTGMSLVRPQHEVSIKATLN